MQAQLKTQGGGSSSGAVAAGSEGAPESQQQQTADVAPASGSLANGSVADQPPHEPAAAAGDEAAAEGEAESGEGVVLPDDLD